MAKEKSFGRTNRFKTYGKYEKRGDAYSGLNQLSSEKQKAMAETRMRAQKLQKRIAKEGVDG